MNSSQRRQQRRKDLRSIKERVQNEGYKGIFYTNQIIKDSGFVDFMFIGNYKGREVAWNACISTYHADYYDHVNMIALDEAHEKYDNVDWSLERTMDVTSRPESDKLYRYCAERTIEMLNAGQHPIPRWNIEVDESYKWGVGLHIRVNKPRLNIDDIIDFIAKFNELGPEGTFADKDLTPAALTADELGVELVDGSSFVHWKGGFSPDVVQLDIEI